MFLFLVLLAVGGEAATWVMKLEPRVDPVHFAEEHHLHYEGRPSFLPPNAGYHLFGDYGDLSPTSKKRREQSFRSAEGVTYAKLQEGRRFFKRGRAVLPDPLYEDQWHLHSHPIAVDADYAGANVTGAGITIAIVDDGLQHIHPEIRANYDAAHSWDFNDKDSDPSPNHIMDRHGTSCAAVAAAVKENGHCGRGVAYGAKLVGYRAIAAPLTDFETAQALTHNAIATVSIFSCSWGPTDDGQTIEAPDEMVEEALAWHTNGKRGRLGKGTIYVWAAGNGRDNGDSCAYDGWAASPYVITIGAMDHTGAQSWYSESCSALMAVCPSSGASRGIVTADLLGGPDGECTRTFGGTSSATPLAAGIIALLLQERSDLTWRDVMHVIAKGATQMDNEASINSRRYRHSEKFGFGLMKIPPLLRVARAHQLVPDMKTWESAHNLIGDAKTLPIVLRINVTNCDISFIEQVTVTLAIMHPVRGRVSAILKSPEGIVSNLAPARPRDMNENWPLFGFRLLSRKHWGEATSNGTWVVEVNSLDNQGQITKAHLKIHGY